MMIYHSNVLLSIFLIIFIDLHSNLINCNPALTENQIKEDIKFLSQTGDGIKPSRLRALLLADLKKALTATVCSNLFLLIYCVCVFFISLQCTETKYFKRF